MASKTTLSSHRSAPENKVNTRIPDRLIWVAWISLLALTVLNLIIYIVGIPAYFPGSTPSTQLTVSMDALPQLLSRLCTL